MVFAEWGGLPPWEFDALHLGDDDHRSWLGVPTGTLMTRPRATSRDGVDQLVLVPDAPYAASFHALGDEGGDPCEVFVDVCTVPTRDAGVVTAVDLDLDVVRARSGRAWADDEEESAAHGVHLDSPRHVVDLAVGSCTSVRRAVESARPPRDQDTRQPWFDALAQVMTA